MYAFAIVVAAFVGVIMLYEKIRGINLTKIPMWLVFLPFLYILPLLFGRVESVQATWNGMIVMSVLVFTAYILWKLKLEPDGDLKLKLLITRISWLVLLVSYAVLLRVFSLSEFVMELSKDVSGLGARLGGFVQYPNAFASLLASMILFHLVASTREENVKGFLFNIALLPGLFSLLLLTESRGAWLLFSVVYMISVAIVKERRLHYVLLSAYVFISGGILYMSHVADGTIYASWHTVLLLIVFAGILYYLQPGKWNRLQRFEKFAPYVVPVLAYYWRLMYFSKVQSTGFYLIPFKIVSPLERVHSVIVCITGVMYGTISTLSAYLDEVATAGDTSCIESNPFRM